MATRNLGKFDELRSILAGSTWRLELHPKYEDVVEGDTSYAENAAAKARALFERVRATGEAAAVLGDDSGLEVAALDGRPGVLSARYGGPGATWAQRRDLLLAELRATVAEDRRARFVCALHFIGPDGRACAVQRALEGEIAFGERGASGFSYDPLFVYLPAGRTFGEMDDAAKNRVSHRALAARALLDAVRMQSSRSPEILARAGNNAPTGT